jgi:hypothetical protein
MTTLATAMRRLSFPSISFRRSFSSSSPMRDLTIDTLNPAFLKVEYAVRGELAIKAETLRDQLKKPGHGLPFDKVISSNIGNPQQKGLDQPPITFTRQVCLVVCKQKDQKCWACGVQRYARGVMITFVSFAIIFALL